MEIEELLAVMVLGFTLVILAAIAISNLIWWARCKLVDRSKDK
ncbi:MAG: hypothetical protein AAFY98_06475 [Verrucomicrobiota bacterium]